MAMRPLLPTCEFAEGQISTDLAQEGLAHGAMDPLSLASSVAGLTSLAITIIVPLAQYSREVRNAPDEIEGIRTQLGALQSVSKQLHAFLKDDDDKNLRFHADSGLRLAVLRRESNSRGSKNSSQIERVDCFGHFARTR
ncbi:hypothetical protein F4780DRAFT_748524 [Xylariomycetidae sp. FL0641]|nr:hypothetical protein F4780DRAFT_748524 [Xylariomycetidae sp. FL0641]